MGTETFAISLQNRTFCKVLLKNRLPTFSNKMISDRQNFFNEGVAVSFPCFYVGFREIKLAIAVGESALRKILLNSGGPI